MPSRDSANAGSTILPSIRWGVIFDLDGVIVDTNPWHRRAVLELCRRYEIQVSDEELRAKVFGIPNRNWIPDLFGSDLDPVQIEVLASEKERIFRELARGSVRPTAGLRSLLEELAMHDVPLAVATSAPPRNTSMLLEETGVRPYFAVILDDMSIEEGKGKPEPDIYFKAAAAIGLQPGRCIVFEDSTAGFRAARAAGCMVIGVGTTHSLAEMRPWTDDAITDFTEVDVARLIEPLQTSASTSER